MQVTGLVHDLGKLLYLFGSEYALEFKSSNVLTYCLEANGTSLAYVFAPSCAQIIHGFVGHIRRWLRLFRQDYFAGDVRRKP
jgi:hypothetical protein